MLTHSCVSNQFSQRAIKENRINPIRNICFATVALFGSVAADISLAYEVAVEFSATAVQIAPGQADNKKKMYVGKDMVRTETVLNNTLLIEIAKTKEQLRIFMVPEDKTYMQQKGSGPAISVAPDESASTKPCAGMRDTNCKLLGTEKINKRQAEKWEFTANQGGQVYLSLHWIDVEHRMLVREFFPDGTFAELTPVGTETINGRHTEKWLWQLSGPNGQIEAATQWYDPELKIAIREETHGGFIRELRDIKTGVQDRSLFEVPIGYKQVNDLRGLQ